jgi:xanthine/uracil permease
VQIRRQKGALLNDAVSGVFSGLAGCLPLTTFAQNNGISAWRPPRDAVCPLARH